MPRPTVKSPSARPRVPLDIQNEFEQGCIISDGRYDRREGHTITMIFDGMVSMVRDGCEQTLKADHVFAWLVPMATAMVLAAAASWVDFHTDEPTVLCGFVFLFCAACGTAFPLRRSWVCALVMAGCLPIYFIIARRLGVRPHWPPAEIHSTNWADLVTVMPGVIGVLVGSGFRSVSAAVVSR